MVSGIIVCFHRLGKLIVYSALDNYSPFVFDAFSFLQDTKTPLTTRV
jgi:hypothetical protein